MTLRALFSRPADFDPYVVQSKGRFSQHCLVGHEALSDDDLGPLLLVPWIECDVAD